MSNSTVYSTVTRGPGDLRAEAAHREAVARMFRAAMRRRCIQPECSEMCECFDSSALGG